MSEQTETMRFPCKNGCGREVATEIPVEGFGRDFLIIAAQNCLCEECSAKEAEEARQREEEERQRAFQESLPKRLEAIGLPERYALDSPPVPFVADWLFDNCNRHIVLSGVTGTGKSTSAGCIARRLTMSSYARVRYYSLRKLLAEWRIAKTSDNQFAAENFVANLAKLDVLIVDELIDKTNVSMSGQELLYELIDGAYSGANRCRLWLLGNFYKGSVAELFTDPQPVLRRFRECFTCGVIEGKQVKKINF